MPDTDIDKLREQIEKAITDEAAVWEATFSAGPGLCVGVPDAATVAARSVSAELVGLRTEVDQLRTENAELRENVVHMESERTGKCLACGEDWTCSGYYADIAHEARIENLITTERDHALAAAVPVVGAEEPTGPSMSTHGLGAYLAAADSHGLTEQDGAQR